MPQYKLTLCRPVYEYCTLTLEAETEEAAINEALRREEVGDLYGWEGGDDTGDARVIDAELVGDQL